MLDNQGGKMQTRELVMWVIIAVLVIAVLYIFLFSGADSSTVGSASQAAQTSYSGMVGGC